MLYYTCIMYKLMLPGLSSSITQVITLLRWSCINLWESGYVELTNGISVHSRMSVKRNRSTMPSKMQISVRPFLEIPAQTCTLTGCFCLQEQYNVILLCTCV